MSNNPHIAEISAKRSVALRFNLARTCSELSAISTLDLPEQNIDS
jgi:hypothetical protein